MRRDDEKTCENCMWSSGFSQIWGHCRNPRNSQSGSAGSDYSRADVIVPMSIRINQVCDLHEEKGEGSNLRDAFKMESYQVSEGSTGFMGYTAYSTKWRRSE